VAEVIRIVCRSCGRRWDYGGPVSDYGREAVETRPCPGCGCCTLAANEASGVKQFRPKRKIESSVRR